MRHPTLPPAQTAGAGTLPETAPSTEPSTAQSRLWTKVRDRAAHRYSGAMQLSPDLGVFWRGGDTVQIGFDPRIQMIFSGLSHGEQLLVSELTRPHTDADLDIAAKEHGVTPSRLSDIIGMLRSAGLLVDAASNPAAIARRSRTVSWNPDRSRNHISITRLDPLGTAIGLALVHAGIGTVTSPDTTPTSPDDAPELRTESLGLPRNDAFARAARNVRPATEHAAGTPDFAILTGAYIADPFAAEPLAKDGIPHLLAWTEDVDVCIGPLVEPGLTCCSQCLYFANADTQELWPLLAPQAIAMSSPAIAQSTAMLAASLAVRAVLAFLDRGGNPLANRGWRIPPIPAMPRIREHLPSPRCGCLTTALSPSGNHL